MAHPVLWALGTTSFVASVSLALVTQFENASRPRDRGAAVLNLDQAGLGGTNPTRFAPNSVTLAADSLGHFSTEVDVAGRSLRMLVDTGASICAFSYEDAQRLGLHVYERDFNRRIDTANGAVSAATIRVPVMRIGTIGVRDVEAVVLPKGRLGKSLLGMSFLRRLNDFKMSDGRLTLRG
ncbi:TIGR02281 family clan AA aspartic protease [Methylobacterium sp. E-045]|uniref:retropepsin-like aspartic protease family protein n=1 Tax=Methylobacterium sp. E-045 TaxID=2836575 RepID=UPI001FBB6139|nr:TIGR02281 family clan AA aspartic protease [Methylobacterium sp. E-045]MCJ2128614.1 TIGR02281 family clan AA aspartic protease [Methylobacterium sp. E-045]